MDPNQPETPPTAEYTSGEVVPPEARTMGMLCHLLGIFTWFIGALVIWLMKKEEMPFVDDQGKEALNFQITVTLAYVVCSVLAIVGIGFCLYPVVWVGALVLLIMAAVKANKGERYRYPFALRLIK